MMKSFKNLILSAFLLVFSTNLLASHVSGGNISYRCTGNPYEYLITLVVYQDCNGIAGGQAYNLIVNNDCGLVNPTVTVNIVDTLEVSQLCDGSVALSTCNGGTLAGNVRYVYEGLVTIPDYCDAWTFGWRACNRNTLTNIDNSPCFYVETKSYSVTQNCNTSVVLNNPNPIPYVCINQGVNYDYGVVENEGDSLDFTLITPMIDYNTFATFTVPFTQAAPIPNIFVHQQTGAVNFNSSISGNFVVAILVKEYNSCGDLISSTVHDIQFVLDATCVNNAPYQSNAPNGTVNLYNFNNFGTNAVLDTVKNRIKMCLGDQFCFDVNFTDNDPADVLEILFSDLDTIVDLPGATITQTGTNPATATVCWSYVSNYQGAAVSLLATDNVCPIPGNVSIIIDLDLPPALYPGSNDSIPLCGDEGVINLNDYLGSIYQNDGEWKYNGTVINNLVNVSTLTAGDYYYVVQSDTLTVNCVPISNCATADSSLHVMTISNLSIGNLVLVNEACANQNNGSATIGPITGGNGPFTVVWNFPAGGGIDTIHNNAATGSVITRPGLYQHVAPWNVTVTDAIGCEISTNYHIIAGQLELKIITNPPTCFGYNDGSISVQDTTTNNPNAIQFNFTDINGGNVGTGNVANNLAAGTYTATAINQAGCNVSVDIVLEEPGEMFALFNMFEPNCHGDAEGIIIVNSINDSEGVTRPNNTVTFNWAPDPTNYSGLGHDTYVNLAAGEYSLKWTDAAGCFNDTTIFVTQPDPLTAKLTIVKPTFCRTAAYQSGNGTVTVENVIDSSGAGGDPDYTWVNLQIPGGDISHAPTYNVKVPGLIQITLLDDHDCVYIDTIRVDSVNPIADFIITSDQFGDELIYEGQEPVQINIKNTSLYFNNGTSVISEFQWNFHHNNPDSSGGNWFLTSSLDERPDTTYMAININEPTIYEVCLVTKNYNNCKDTTCKEVIVHPVPVLDLPNVFTPGADPNNEFFFPARGIEEFNAVVMNRYGVKVFEFTDVTDKWNGDNYKNGKQCVDGVYFYSYTYKTTEGLTLSNQGQVHLIRVK